MSSGHSRMTTILMNSQKLWLSVQVNNLAKGEEDSQDHNLIEELLMIVGFWGRETVFFLYDYSS